MLLCFEFRHLQMLDYGVRISVSYTAMAMTSQLLFIDGK